MDTGVTVKTPAGVAVEIVTIPAHVVVDAVKVPVKPGSLAVTVCAAADPVVMKVTVVGVTLTVPGGGLAVGVAEGVGDGLALGVGLAVALAVGPAVGAPVDVGLAEGVGDGEDVLPMIPATGAPEDDEQPHAVVKTAAAKPKAEPFCKQMRKAAASR